MSLDATSRAAVAYSRCSYTKNGMIGMMQRNVVVKKAPQRFQEEKDLSKIDICICFDDRVFDAVIESSVLYCVCCVDLQFRPCHGMKPLLVLNMHTQDKPAMAEEGARHALRLATMVYVSVLYDP